MNSKYVSFVLGGTTAPRAFACVGASPHGLFEVWGGAFADHETDAQRESRYRSLEQLSDWFNYGSGTIPVGWRRASHEEDHRIRTCLRETMGATHL